MCHSELHDFLCVLPKCEHHIHVEGALTPQLLITLAAKNSIELPSNDPAFLSVENLLDRYNRFVSLDDFLHYYYIGMSVLVTKADFEALAWNYFEHAARDGVVHAEVFFDPQAHLSRGVSYDVIISGFSSARIRAAKELDISSELICCFLRHLPVADSLATFELEELKNSFKRGDISGIGLDSSEKEYPPELFRGLYQKAKTLGLRRTAHAGEEGPSSYIRSAIDTLEVERIDHGIRLANDPELLKQVADKGMLLTVCPLSNVLLRCANTVSDLPIQKFLDAGVQFSINSDDPAYFGNHFILDNYCAVQDAFDLDAKQWYCIAEAGIRASWCSEERKTELLIRLRTAMNQWTQRA